MEDHYYQHMADIQARHWWYEGRRRILDTVIKRLSLPATARIIEVGCGTGANLLMLKQHGHVVGVEPHDFGRHHAAEVSACDVQSGMLPDGLPFTGPYDLVGVFDVIEHVDDDAGSLKTLHALTAPGGYALFTVPAWMFLWSQHDVINHHKRRYTKPAFKALLKAAGYEVIFISYYNILLFPVITAIRMAKNILHITDRPDMTAPPPGPLNAFLCALFASERHILGRLALPFGVSIIALCRKT
jgi:SAM-dependent methyltransferase